MCPTVFTVNNTNEVGPTKVMTFSANKTTVTLSHLNASMLYKFYLSAKTIKGSGPDVTNEAFTVMDTGETSESDKAFYLQTTYKIQRSHPVFLWS